LKFKDPQLEDQGDPVHVEDNDESTTTVVTRKEKQVLATDQASTNTSKPEQADNGTSTANNKELADSSQLALSAFQIKDAIKQYHLLVRSYTDEDTQTRAEATALSVSQQITGKLLAIT